MTEKKKQAAVYFVCGCLNTIIAYAIYEVLALTVFSGEELLAFATLVSGAVSVVTGYVLHSKFTWKERIAGKKEAGKFLVWNIVMAVAIKPLLTLGFQKMSFLYELAFNIFQAIHIPFSYEFVETTGVFVLMTAVVMVINFLVYDRFVFGKKKDKGGEKIDMEGVRKTGEEV